MISDIAILKEMLTKQAIVPLEDSHDKKQVILTETDGVEYSVTIYGMPDDAIVIKADTFPAPTAVFCGSKDECKRADFVIVADTGKKKVIVCIELKAKSSTCSASEIIQQLKGAQCFIHYCQSIGTLFWEQQDFLKTYEYRFVSIRNISISKRSKQKSSKTGKIHNRPEQMLKISSPHRIYFNELVGK